MTTPRNKRSHPTRIALSVPLIPALILTLATVGCYRSSRVLVSHQADSEIDPGRYGTLVVLDLAYRGGELELGELTARRLREEIETVGTFEVVPLERTRAALEQIEGFDFLDPDHQRRLGELTGAELLVTGEVEFSRYGSLEYHERLAESYDVDEQDSPSMLFGRSDEAMDRQTDELFVLDVTLRGYDTATGEQVWKRNNGVELEREQTSRTPPGRGELLSIFNNLLDEVALDVKNGLQPHLVSEYRYIIP